MEEVVRGAASDRRVVIRILLAGWPIFDLWDSRSGDWPLFNFPVSLGVESATRFRSSIVATKRKETGLFAHTGENSTHDKWWKKAQGWQVASSQATSLRWNWFANDKRQTKALELYRWFVSGVMKRRGKTQEETWKGPGESQLERKW